MNKEKYQRFCENVYVPIYSKSWWMDAICGPENWDVWLYEKGGSIWAAMPYYVEMRGSYRYITKAPLTQTNGLIISYPSNQKIDSKQSYEEEIINAATEFIQKFCVDVYEQQYSYTFQNFLPFFWKGYSAIPRVTYVIEDTADMQQVEKGFSSNCRKNIRKGQRFIKSISAIAPERFYAEHKKIFERQQLDCPFSESLWMKLYSTCIEHDSGEILTAQDELGNILSLIFLIWDERSMYLLLGGAIPEYASMQTYSVLVGEGIRLASMRGLKFDFEGSVIKRINHAFREYGGTPKQYFRIRKVFNSEIICAETQEQIKKL